MKIFFNCRNSMVILVIILALNNPVFSQIGVRSVGFNIGAYSPSMDYWNDNALITWDNKFSAGLYGNVNIEINVIKILGVRLGVGYWNQELKESGIEHGNELRSDNISIQFLPVNFDLIVHSPEEMSKIFNLYGGIGTGINFISMEYTISIPSIGDNVQNHSGRSWLFHLIVGADYKVMKNIAVGAEFKYILAKYNQEVLSGTNKLEQDVSLNGPQIMATIKYLF